MKKLICFSFAGKGLLLILTLLSFFHILILVKIIPYTIVWGGKLKDAAFTEAFILESVSLIITVLFIIITAQKMNYLWPGKFVVITNIGVWIILVFMLLSFFGNLTSSVLIENLILGPVSLIAAVFALRLGIEK